MAAEVRSPFFFPLSITVNKYKSPCGAEGEEKARYPQGRGDAKQYFDFYFSIILKSPHPLGPIARIHTTGFGIRAAYVKLLMPFQRP